MDPAIAQVRSFNRLVTQAAGALADGYLSRDRPLGEARVLWEIGTAGCDLRELRRRLGLDSGYLSRLVRSLEQAGLITVQPLADDRRVRTARLTSAGLAERELLEERSDELARSFLAPLSDTGRSRLVAAMAEVEQLLTSALIEFKAVDPASPDAQSCLQQYVAELDERFENGFDTTLSISAGLHELRPPAGLFVIGALSTGPVGCGALKFHGDEPAELKRMWVAGSARGLGVGRRLLAELERRAAAAGATVIRLETNKSLTEAITLYRSAGYREVDAFNDEPYAHHWFEKDLRLSSGLP
jgi:DNA-binding MarR family transcriptional regulator/GNAT superfamily N-acetyltransferase